MNTAPTTTARYRQLRFRGRAPMTPMVFLHTWQVFRHGRHAIMPGAGLMPMPRKVAK